MSALDRAIPGRPDAPNRSEHDFYRTPRVAVEALLKVETFEGRIWEPACGDGAISEVLLEHGYTVRSTDLIDRGYGVQVNFLDPNIDRAFPRYPNIITNPPFKLMQAFAEQALLLTDKKVALLGRLLWLAGQKRKPFFESSGLARVHVFSYRINSNRDADPRFTNGLGGMVDFCWFVWDRAHVGPTTVDWL